MAGGRKAPRHEIAGWERRWCHSYGDFAAASGVDVVEGGDNVHNFARQLGGSLHDWNGSYPEKLALSITSPLHPEQPT
jgi:hypothetical protein